MATADREQVCSRLVAELTSRLQLCASVLDTLPSAPDDDPQQQQQQAGDDSEFSPDGFVPSQSIRAFFPLYIHLYPPVCLCT